MSKSITVVMPALNEERNLEAAVQSARRIISPYFEDWEILIFNDGSTDKTGKIADRLALSDPKVHAFHHKKSKNLGGVYRAGVELATKEYLIMLPGDNENGSDTGKNILECAGSADVIIPFVKNTEVRPFSRRLISALFVKLVNFVSGCRLKYYNGTVLHKTAILKQVSYKTNGFGYQAEILINLIRAGHSFMEVGVELVEREKGRSNALRPRNFLQVAKFLGTVARRSHRVV